MKEHGAYPTERRSGKDRRTAARPEEKPTRTKAQCLAAVVEELHLDTTDPFTRILAAAFALQDAYDESRAALARCQQIVHDQAAPSPQKE